MRNHLLDYLQLNKIKPFPRFNKTRCKGQFIDVTNDIEKRVFQIKHILCHKPKQSSFVSIIKYDILLNCNNEQPDVDFTKKLD